MSTETLELRLKAFWLPSFLAHYAPLADQAAKAAGAHALPRRTPRPWRRSNAPSGRSRDWSKGSFCKEPRTCACSAIRAQASPMWSRRSVTSWYAQGHSVLFTPVSALVERLLEAKRDLRLSRELRRLDRIECLILDDIGYVQHDRGEMEVLFALLAERYERRSVAITSNLVFSKWDQIFQDPMTTARDRPGRPPLGDPGAQRQELSSPRPRTNAPGPHVAGRTPRPMSRDVRRDGRTRSRAPRRNLWICGQLLRSSPHPTGSTTTGEFKIFDPAFRAPKNGNSNCRRRKEQLTLTKYGWLRDGDRA